MTLILRDELDHIFFHKMFFSDKLYSLPVGLGLLAYGTAFLMLQYLRGSLTLRRPRTLDDEQTESAAFIAITALRNKVLALSEELKSLKSAQLGALSGNRNELIEELKPTIYQGLTDELTQRFSEQSQQAARDTEIRDAFANAHRRLQVELSSLSRRSNLNLVIGVITTSIAVGLLTYMVLGTTTKLDSITSILSHYVPRLALVIFIEIFSFFFLRLYRATLAEMRTYQTDLTSLTIQFVAVQAALSAKTPESAIELSKELLLSKPKIDNSFTENQHQEADAKAISELLQGVAKAILQKSKSN